jgi:protein-tyrosine phosphatase
VGAPVFVDCHSHVVPSGDDGVGSIAEGRALCREAARRGTAILYATPHVWPHLVLTEEREAAVRAAYARLAPQAGLELRLGWELTPTASLLDQDPHRYVLEGSDCVLVEVPFSGSAQTFFAVGEHIEAAGLTPVVAHPERTEAVVAEESLASRISERGWPVQVNATSLVGYHGPEIEALAWRLIDRGEIAVVGSDGHRAARPPFLDGAFELAAARLGFDAALRLFDGSALGVTAARLPASRAASPGS